MAEARTSSDTDALRLPKPPWKAELRECPFGYGAPSMGRAALRVTISPERHSPKARCPNRRNARPRGSAVDQAIKRALRIKLEAPE